MVGSDERDIFKSLKADEQPVFEIKQHHPERHIRIYASGRVEGLTDCCTIVNRIPLLLLGGTSGEAVGE